MKNIKEWSEFSRTNENYPPGAADDSRAPWNQKEPDYNAVTFDDVLCTADGEEIPVTVKYRYFYNEPDSVRKQISDYEYNITGDKSKLNPEYIEEDIRELIVNHIGDKYYDWVI